MTPQVVKSWQAWTVVCILVCALAGWGAPVLSGQPGLRAIPPQSLHLTLCFLGWRAATDLSRIASACQTVGGEPAVELSANAGRWLPASSASPG